MDNAADAGVVIIGAGHGGSQLAVSLRDEGYGGAITLIDADPAVPYQKPPLSKTFLADPVATPQPLRAEALYARADITRLAATVAAIDAAGHRVVTEDGQRIAYRHLVLAQGARARTSPAYAGYANVMTLRDLADATKIRARLGEARRIGIVGAGFIGLEAAAAFGTIGKEVTLFKAPPRILRRIAAPEVSAFIERRLAGYGIELLNGANVVPEIGGDRITAFLDRGRRIAVDLVLLAIGSEPVTELAAAAGLPVADGVLVDETLRTPDPDIYAIGDAVRYPHWVSGEPERIESVQNATDQARTLARTLATGVPQVYRKVPWFWSDIGKMKLQIVGLTRGSDQRIVRETGEQLVVAHLAAGRLIAVETVNSPRDHMIARQLIEKGITPGIEALRQGAEALMPLIKPDR